MELALRSALLTWLRADPALAGELNDIADESPVTASAPWLGVAASVAVDWGAKTCRGREVRLALELATRGADSVATQQLTSAIAARVETLPSAQTGFAVASIQFLRGRAERRKGNLRSTLLEYRFRILEPLSEIFP